MKKALLIFAAMLSIVALSSVSHGKTAIVPLTEYLANQDMGDPQVLLYLSARCAAINSVAVYKSKDSPNLKELHDTATLAVDEWAQRAIMVRGVLQSGDSAAENQENIVKLIGLIVKKFGDVMDNGYAATGMYFTEWMMDDVSTCSAYQQALR